MLILTVSRQTGSLGEEFARELSRTFGLPLIDREYVNAQWLSAIAKPNQLNILKDSPKAHLSLSSEGIPFHVLIENRLMDTIKETGAIIVGLGAQVIFQKSPHSFHIRVIAPESERINQVCNQYGIDSAQAKKLITLSDRKHRKYLFDIYSKDWEDNSLYHLILNTGKMTIDEATKMVVSMFPDEVRTESLFASMSIEEKRSKNRDFVHQSEVEFVKILDMYHIEWLYEPTTFPIEWDAEGNLTMAFTPDFFLPAYQTYIELTTMNQKYVTEKNKKVRRLKALYPDINIIILYKRDINKLLKKFGVIREA